MNIKSEISGARSAVARWIDGHLRLTSILAAPVAVLAVWKAIELAAWIL